SEYSREEAHRAKQDADNSSEYAEYRIHWCHEYSKNDLEDDEWNKEHWTETHAYEQSKHDRSTDVASQPVIVDSTRQPAPANKSDEIANYAAYPRYVHKRDRPAGSGSDKHAQPQSFCHDHWRARYSAVLSRLDTSFAAKSHRTLNHALRA